MATTRKTFTIGGVKATRQQVEEAIDILTAAPGVMVKQPLTKAGNALAESDYHSVASEERAFQAEKLATKPAFQAEKLATKPAFILALQRALSS